MCQPGESLPRETSALRLSLEATVGPRVAVELLVGSRRLDSGTRGSGWTAASVTVPVKPLGLAVSHVTLCFAIAATRVRVGMLGADTPRAQAARLVGGGALPGRVRVEYMRAGHASWLSLARSVARRMGLGRAVAGSWIALLALGLMLALAVAVAGLLLRELDATGRTQTRRSSRRGRLLGALRRVPGAAWVCALVAFLNAACWSVITPPFQVPDETSHFAYVQVLAESGRLPVASRREASPAMEVVLRDLESYRVRFAPQQRSIASAEQQRALEHDMALPLSREGPGGAGSASSEPPLYSALETIPYELGAGGSLLDQLELMRLLSALMAAAAALFGYLFVREALPGSRWAWTVGGLAIALFPLLGFISGGVNPDALLFTVCAALYYCLARGFRRGLTPRLAIATGLLVASGFATKLNFVGFAPGAVLGLVFLCARAARRGLPGATAVTPAAYRKFALALAIAVGPVLLYGLLNLLSGKPALGEASATLAATRGSLAKELSYMWQFYLPRLPGMLSFFPASSRRVSCGSTAWWDSMAGRTRCSPAGSMTSRSSQLA